MAIVVAAALAPFAGIERANRPLSIDNVLFSPSKYPEGNWTSAQLRYEDVYFRSEDGILLHGWLCETQESRGTVLYLHGNAGNIATRVEFLHDVQTKLRLDIFAFDYRGYGRSKGRPSVDGAFLDTLAAHKEVCRRLSLDDHELIVMGESLGGAYAIKLAQKSPPRALILQSTFSSLRDLAEVHYPSLAPVVPTQTLNSIALLREYSGPLLQVHGTDDQVVPISLARKLNLTHNGSLNLFHEHVAAGHNNLVSDSFIAQIDQFVRLIQVSERRH